MLKIMTLLAIASPGWIIVYKNKSNTEDNKYVTNGKSNNRIANLSNSTKVKKSFEISFFTFEISLTFTLLKKTFIKAPILYYLDLKYYIRIKTNVSSYIIGKILS